MPLVDWLDSLVGVEGGLGRDSHSMVPVYTRKSLHETDVYQLPIGKTEKKTTALFG